MGDMLAKIAPPVSSSGPTILGSFGNAFDPEGDGYDYDTARKRGMGPAGKEAGDDVGHWSSRDPETGMLLKGASHPTFSKAVEEDAKMGFKLTKKNGRYYTLKDDD